MDKNENKIRTFPMNTVRICVDEYRRTASGRAYSKLAPVPVEFTELTGMLLGLDRLFDRCGYPQAFQERRSFRKQSGQERPREAPQTHLTDAEMDRQEGRYRTLDLVVQSRRQAGWQGLLMQPDRTLVLRFRSEMELLNGLSRELERTG